VRTFLGFVTSGSSGIFEIPSDFLSGTPRVQLVAEPIGSILTFSTGPILVFPDQVIHWTVRNRLTHSSFSVR